MDEVEMKEVIKCKEVEFMKALKIINQNVRGIHNTKITAYFLIIKDEEPDVVVLTETYTVS